MIVVELFVLMKSSYMNRQTIHPFIGVGRDRRSHLPKTQVGIDKYGLKNPHRI